MNIKVILKQINETVSVLSNARLISIMVLLWMI
jgi:hypothetical protein